MTKNKGRKKKGKRGRVQEEGRRRLKKIKKDKNDNSR